MIVESLLILSWFVLAAIPALPNLSITVQYIVLPIVSYLVLWVLWYFLAGITIHSFPNVSTHAMPKVDKPTQPTTKVIEEFANAINSDYLYVVGILFSMGIVYSLYGLLVLHGIAKLVINQITSSKSNNVRINNIRINNANTK